ncbi:unnamed protein product [Paramecium pentaurelia]|uniref:MADS-box domain-containing protein n=1 Tax=Paramecium pentaurelia TaxID=43138 RepID=A0A8S1YGV9_9CILI|nr:unnamed protein product [Paramecium pentaurelia]
MGRNKIDIQYIKDDRIRNITFNKRKNGLLKKACELAVLCNIKMLLCFTDLSGTVYQFMSNENTELELISSNHKKIFTKQDYPGFQKKKDNESQSEAESELSIEQKRTRAQEHLNQQHLFIQQSQLIQQNQQYHKGQQQMRLRNKVLENNDKQIQQESRKIVKIEPKQEEFDQSKNKLQAKNKKKNDEIAFNDIIDHQQARNFDDLYQCGNQLDDQSNSPQDQQDYKQQLSMFTSSNPIKLMKMDSLLNGNNNSKPHNFLSDQYNKFFNKDRIDSLNNSKVLQPSVQFIVPPQVYFNITPSPINQAMNKIYVGVDEPMEFNLGQSQYTDGFKKYTK